MKRSITLYIGGERVDLDKQGLILFNYTQEDLSNPTIVKNSYSQKVKVPGTPNNNRIFGDIFRFDRKTNYNSQYTGVHFDVTRKTPFAIYDELNNIVESGYMKLDGVNKKGLAVEYEISLYGGLGGFFYALSYDEAGEKLTLGHLQYTDVEGNKERDFICPPGKASVADAWDFLRETYPALRVARFWNIINFAPCYNGYPKDFDSNKAVVADRYGNVPFRAAEGSKSYSYKPGTTSNLMTFAQNHTEWEVRDLRWYLQRPAVSVWAFLQAIADPANNGGYDVELDASFFNDSNKLIRNGWITLPFVNKENRKNDNWLNVIMRGSKTPADILLSLGKSFGLLFVYNSQTRKVQIMSRNTFYQNAQTIDITDRVDTETMDIQPLLADSKFYRMGGKVEGEFAEAYKQNYGRDYGTQKINTGYDFDVKIKDITDKLIFGSRVESLEKSYSYPFYATSRGGFEHYLPMPVNGEICSIQLWDSAGTASIEVNAVNFQAQYIVQNSELFPFYDLAPKAQMHKEKNEPINGDNILLVFAGTEQVAEAKIGGQIRKNYYYITEDTEDMTTLNSGKPCWNLVDGDRIHYIPVFRRGIESADYPNAIADSYEFGIPAELDSPSMAMLEGASLYAHYWQKYLTDRYDVDTKVVKCKVNLNGVQVGQNLLRRFYWFGDSLWVLNKICNYSITTNDLTECEFVKVNDKMNYTHGQN